MRAAPSTPPVPPMHRHRRNEGSASCGAMKRRKGEEGHPLSRVRSIGGCFLRTKTTLRGGHHWHLSEAAGAGQIGRKTRRGARCSSHKGWGGWVGGRARSSLSEKPKRTGACHQLNGPPSHRPAATPCSAGLFSNRGIHLLAQAWWLSESRPRPHRPALHLEGQQQAHPVSRIRCRWKEGMHDGVDDDE